MTRRDLDELHAAAIRDVVADLNRIVAAATADGLDVEIRVDGRGREDDGIARDGESLGHSPVIVATVCPRPRGKTKLGPE